MSAGETERHHRQAKSHPSKEMTQNPHRPQLAAARHPSAPDPDEGVHRVSPLCAAATRDKSFKTTRRVMIHLPGVWRL